MPSQPQHHRNRQQSSCSSFRVPRSLRQVALPGDILLDAVKAALRAVSANVGEVEGEGPHLLRAVRLGNGDVLWGEGVLLWSLALGGGSTSQHSLLTETIHWLSMCNLHSRTCGHLPLWHLLA